LGIGDWGLGIGDWGLGPIPNPQSPIPIIILLKFNKFINKLNFYLFSLLLNLIINNLKDGK